MQCQPEHKRASFSKHSPIHMYALSALDRRYGANSGVLRKVGATMLLSPVYTMCFFGYMAVLESLKIRYYYESGNSSDRCNSLSDRREIKKYSDSESYKKSGDFSSRFPSSSSSSSPSSLSSTPLSESLKSSSQSSPLAPPPISIYDDVVIRLEGKMEKVVPTVAVSYCFW